MAKILAKTYTVRNSIAEERRLETSAEFVRARYSIACEFEVSETDLVTVDGKRKLAPEVKVRLQAAIASLIERRCNNGRRIVLDAGVPFDIAMTGLGVYHGTTPAGTCRGYVKAHYRWDTWSPLPND